MRRLAALLVLAGLAAGAARAQNVDCRQCHGGADSPAPLADFSRYYSEPSRHHPRAAAYPDARDSQFRQPDWHSGDVAWFDRDGNPAPDAGEVQLFGAARTVECASCHREHGAAGQTPAPGQYLRVTQEGSALCGVCHRK